MIRQTFGSSFLGVITCQGLLLLMRMPLFDVEVGLVPQVVWLSAQAKKIGDINESMI